MLRAVTLKKAISFRSALKQVRAGDRTLTSWMRENGADFMMNTVQDVSICANSLQSLGLPTSRNDHGGPLTEATISKTWARQRQHMLTPKNVLKPGELVPGVVLRTDEILAVQPATAVIADSTSPSSQTIAGQQNVASRILSWNQASLG